MYRLTIVFIILMCISCNFSSTNNNQGNKDSSLNSNRHQHSKEELLLNANQHLTFNRMYRFNFRLPLSMKFVDSNGYYTDVIGHYSLDYNYKSKYDSMKLTVWYSANTGQYKTNDSLMKVMKSWKNGILSGRDSVEYSDYCFDTINNMPYIKTEEISYNRNVKTISLMTISEKHWVAVEFEDDAYNKPDAVYFKSIIDTVFNSIIIEE